MLCPRELRSRGLDGFAYDKASSYTLIRPPGGFAVAIDQYMTLL